MLRTYFPDVKLLALTATADKDLERKTVKSLGMKSFTMIRVSPNRINICLAKVKCTKLSPTLLQWVVDGLKDKRKEYEKTIIYCQSIENVSKVYLYLKEELGSDAYDPTKRDKTANSLLIGMFHRKTLEKHKQRVLNDLADTTGSCRVVIATTSLEMGIDMRDIKCVIHYGSPREVVDYIQGIGRAGRDKCNARAILYFSRQQMSKASSDMKAYANNSDSCLRKVLYGKFDTCEVKQPPVKHNCCSFCQSTCSCNGEGSCHLSQSYYGITEKSSIQQANVRNAADDEKELFLEVLKDYKVQLEENHPISFTDREYLIGLSLNAMKEIVNHVNVISTVDYILSSTPVYQLQQAGEILLMVQDIFGDIDKIELEKARAAVSKNYEASGQATKPLWIAEDDTQGIDDEDWNSTDEDVCGYFEDFEEICFSDSEQL